MEKNTIKRLSREEELELLEECLRHDACDRLVQQYWRMIHVAVLKTFRCYNVSFTEYKIEDMVQNSFLRLFENNKRLLEQYDSDRGLSLAGWVRMITVQTVIMDIRKPDEPIYPQQFVDEMVPEQGPDTGDRIDAKMKLRHLTKVCLKKLPYQEKLIFKMHFFEELSLPDIASFLHKLENNIYQIKHRGIKKIRECMEKWEKTFRQSEKKK